MKKFLLFVLIHLCISSLAQESAEYPRPKYRELFKTLAYPIRADDPLWVRLMYSAEPNFQEVVNAYEAYYKTHPFEKNVHTQNYKHFYRMVSTGRLYDATGKIYIDKTYNEIEIQARKAAEAASVRSESVNSISQSSNGPWTALAPFETFGPSGDRQSFQVNVYCIAQSKTDPNLMYAGTETGALFKSIDKADNWTEVGASVLNYGAPMAIKIDPFNNEIVYVLYDSYLVKSTDGGANWSVVIQNDDGIDFEVNPLNSSYLYIAGLRGLRQSLDGGQTWTTVTPDPVTDIEFKANDPNTIFFAKKDLAKNCYVVYKSSNNLQAFAEKINGWFSPTNGVAVTATGAKIATTPADPNRVYVLLLGSDVSSSEDLNYLGVYRSDDAGETWTLPYDGDGDGQPDNNPGGPYSCTHWSMSSFGICGGTYDQGFYNADIDISDTDPNVFMVGMINLFKSTDGGVTFKWHGGYGCTNCSPGYRHADIQDILVQGSDVWVASDGGLDKYDPNLEFVGAKIKGITTTDFWGYDQGWNEDVVVGGRYHNGNMAYHENYQNGRSMALNGGESATGFVNLGDNMVVYHDDIGGKRIPETLPGTLINVPDPAIYPNRWGSRVGSEIVNDPRFYNTIYLGNDNKLYRSTDYGQTNTVLKEFGTNGHKVTGIEISRRDPNLIFVGHHTGTSVKFWKSVNAGNTWTEITLPITTNRFSFSLNENDELYLSFDIAGNSTNKVFKSVDFGQSWTNLTTATLNGFAILDSEVQEGTNGGVYIISARNVFYRNNTMPDWANYSEGIPANFRLLEAKPFYKKSKLRLAGNRGVWERDFYEPSLPKAQPMVAKTYLECGRQGIQFDDYSTLDHTGATWSWSFPGATTVSSTTVRTPMVTYANPGVYDVTLTVTNAHGTSTKTVPQMITVAPSECAMDTVPGKAISFNDVGQYVTHSYATPKAYTNFTITAWIKPNGIQSNYSSLFYSYSNASSNTISLDFKNSINELGTHAGGKWSFNSGLEVMPDKWSFVALIYTPTRVTIMLNEHSVNIDGNFGTHLMETFDIGSHNRRNDRQFKGEVEEVHMYDRALTLDEIRLNSHLIRPGLVDVNHEAYFQFNDIHSGLIYDIHSNKNLTVAGTPQLVASTAPVGSGVSQMINVTGSGTYDFESVGVKLNITEYMSARGPIVISRIFQAPANPRANVPVEGNEYWTIDNYREFGVIDDVTSTVIHSQKNWSSDLTSGVRMYYRYVEDFNAVDWSGRTASSVTKPDIVTIPSPAYDWSSMFYLGRSGTTNTWTGNTSTEWNVSTNWSMGAIPTSSNNVHIPNTINKPVIASGVSATALKLTIATGASLQINGNLSSNSGIVLADGASLIAGTSNYSGTVTVQKLVSGQRGWRMVNNPFASPLMLSTLAQYNGLTVNQNASANSITDTRLYDQSAASWLNNSSDIASATPFAMFIRGLKREVSGGSYNAGPNPFTMEFGGTLRNHPFTVTPAVATPKFVLIGNPFLAPVNSSALTNGDNVPYYYYQITEGNTSSQKRTKSGNWVAVMSSSTTPVPVLGVIAYQAANLTPFSITTSAINLNHTPGSGYFTNKQLDHYLQLDMVKDGLMADRLFIRQHPLATPVHTDRMDLTKFFNETRNFYLEPGKEKLAVDARNKFGSPIPLTVSSDSGWHSIVVAENKLPEDLEVYLQDRMTASETRLIKGVKYDFLNTENQLLHGKHRFQLIFRGKAAQIPVKSDQLQVSILGNPVSPNSALNFTVLGQKSSPISYKIIGLNGMIHKSGVTLEGYQSVLLGAWPKGLYLLQVENGVETISKKFIIR